MKKRNDELNVDFIGGGEPLTNEEEKALSVYFKKLKIKSIQIIKNKSLSPTKEQTVKV